MFSIKFRNEAFHSNSKLCSLNIYSRYIFISINWRIAVGNDISKILKKSCIVRGTKNFFRNIFHKSALKKKINKKNININIENKSC